MTQHGFYMDTDLCIGCNCCAVACLDWNDIEPGEGVRWRRVITRESGEVPETRLANLSIACLHCEEPACVDACREGAISKRASDGVVVVDREKCQGCHDCFAACPFGAPQYGADGLMQKCDLCLSRMEQGQEPACVVACLTGALHAGTLEGLASLADKKPRRRLAGTTRPSALVSGPEPGF